MTATKATTHRGIIWTVTGSKSNRNYTADVNGHHIVVRRFMSFCWVYYLDGGEVQMNGEFCGSRDNWADSREAMDAALLSINF